MKIIGVLQWFRPFVKNISQKIAPLTELLKNDGKKKWESKHSETVESIMMDIKEQVELSYPDINLPFELETDASQEGIGAVLKQDDKIIGFYSKKFNDTEYRYSIVEKEFLAIVKALLHFRKIVLGCRIQIKTDNRNIITYKTNESNRICRWAWKIADYDFTLEHIEGKQNTIADSLSRCMTILEKTPEKYFTTHQKLIKIYSKDHKYENLSKLHKSLGHPSLSKMKKFAKQHSLSITEFENKLSQCIECHKIKPDCTKKSKSYGTLSTRKPLEDISTDIFGPIKISPMEGEDKTYYIVTFTCRFSRYTEVVFTRNIEAKTITTAFLKSWKKKHGNPKSILCDNGRQYTSSTFRKMCEENNIKLRFCTPNNARGNGISERVNRTLCEILRLTRTHSTKTQIYEMIMSRQNLTWHKTIRMTPYQLVYETTEEQRVLIYQRLMKENEENKQEKTDSDYVIGESVFVKNKTQNKQDLYFLGPFKVLEVTDNNVIYEDRGKQKRVNKRNVKRWSGGKMLELKNNLK